MNVTHSMNFLFEGQSPVRIGLFGLLLVILVGWVDLYVDPEASFSIFYIIPIALAAWYGNGLTGRIISYLAALTWMGTLYASGGPASDSPIIYWNASVRLMFFIIIAYLVSGLKDKTRRLNELAHIDSLTETHNSRSFYSRLEDEINRSRRYRRPFSVAYVDLDNFKSVNDLHGHTVGDRLLIDVTAVMKMSARSTDSIARLGGDEFALLFPEADAKAAREAIQKIRDELHKKMREQGWLVTFSIGLVTYDAPPEDARLVIKTSDELMYSVKKNGKSGIAQRVWNGKEFLPVV